MNWTDWASIVSALAALLSVFLAWRTIVAANRGVAEQLAHAKSLMDSQIEAIRESARGSTAVELYNGFIQLGMRYPEVSNPVLAGGYAAIEKDPRLKTQFHLFMATVLLSCEEILEVRKSEAGWRASIKAFLSRYRDYFEQQDRVAKLTGKYDEALLSIIREIVEEGSTSSETGGADGTGAFPAA